MHMGVAKQECVAIWTVETSPDFFSTKCGPGGEVGLNGAPLEQAVDRAVQEGLGG